MAPSLKDQLQAWKTANPVEKPKPTPPPKAEPPKPAASDRVVTVAPTEEGEPVDLSDEELFLKAVGDIGDGSAAILEKYDATDPGRKRPPSSSATTSIGAASSPVGPRSDSAASERRMFLDAVTGITPMDIREQKPTVEKARAQAAARFARRIGRGELVPGATLDLHGLDREAARERVRDFLSTEAARGTGIVLVVHGKGERVLAELTARELEDHAAVIEHIEAPVLLGGSGARVARLRKS